MEWNEKNLLLYDIHFKETEGSHQSDELLDLRKIAFVKCRIPRLVLELLIQCGHSDEFLLLLVPFFCILASRTAAHEGIGTMQCCLAFCTRHERMDIGSAQLFSG